MEKFLPNPSWPVLWACVVLGFRCQEGDLVQLSSKTLKIMGQTVLYCAMRPLLLQVLVQAMICWEWWKSFPEGWVPLSKLKHSPSRPAWVRPWASNAHTPPRCVGLWFWHALAPLECQCCCPALPSKIWRYPMRWYRSVEYPMRWYRQELWGWVPQAAHHSEYEPHPSRRRWGGSLFLWTQCFD